MNGPDDVDKLLEGLKALPLIDDNADLSRPFAAYNAFELVGSAILRAALVQVPPEQRRNMNGAHFTRFVVEHFPVDRGRGDDEYASDLWLFRCAFQKERLTTDKFQLIEGAPDQHLKPATDGRTMLDLESLIADFRAAVDHLGAELRNSAEMRQVAADELARRHVTVTPVDAATDASFTRNPTTVTAWMGAKAASGTND